MNPIPPGRAKTPAVQQPNFITGGRAASIPPESTRLIVDKVMELLKFGKAEIDDYFVLRYAVALAKERREKECL
jgi:hypothetical protein